MCKRERRVIQVLNHLKLVPKFLLKLVGTDKWIQEINFQHLFHYKAMVGGTS